MSAYQTPVIQEARTTAYSSPTATVVNVVLDTQVSDVTKYLMDVREGPAEMEELVQLPATLHMVSSANAHLASQGHLVSMILARVGV